MAPNELIIGLIIAVLVFFSVMDSVKNPGKQKKHYRSFKSPVASNAELLDAFQPKPDLDEDSDKETNDSFLQH